MYELIEELKEYRHGTILHKCILISYIVLTIAIVCTTVHIGYETYRHTSLMSSLTASKYGFIFDIPKLSK